MWSTPGCSCTSAQCHRATHGALSLPPSPDVLCAGRPQLFAPWRAGGCVPRLSTMWGPKGERVPSLNQWTSASSLAPVLAWWLHCPRWSPWCFLPFCTHTAGPSFQSCPSFFTNHEFIQNQRRFHENVSHCGAMMSKNLKKICNLLAKIIVQ